jgi:lysophospholipase L1-like esterase
MARTNRGVKESACDTADRAVVAALDCGSEERTKTACQPLPASRTKKRFESHPRLWFWAILVLEVAALFAAAEIIAGYYLPPGHRFIHPQMIVEPHARRIFFHKPNQSAFTIDKSFVTNSMGFREKRELSVPKNGEFRILALGDSITVGVGVAAEDTYAKQLEDRLSQAGLFNRVINGGVGAYGTWQEVDVVKEKGTAVQPDLVTLQFLWNDLYPKPETIVPLSVREAQHQEESLKYLRYLKRSRLLLFLRERWSILWNTQRPSFDWTHREMIYHGRTSPYLERAYGDVAKSLEEFAALARGRFVPILLIVPIPMQVQQPDPPPTYLQERIGRLAKQAGLRTIDLLPVLREAYQKDRDLYIPWDGEHFTQQGHRVIAEALQRYLEAEGLLPAPGRM